MKTKLLLYLVIAMSFTSFNTVLAQAPAIDWQKSLGGTNADAAICSKQTPDGGYIVAGLSNSSDGDVFVNHGGNDFWVAKLDDQGNLQWSNSFGGSKNDEAYFISLTSDGGYIVAGLSFSDDGDATVNHGGADYWIVKIDAIGNLQWQKSYGGSQFDKANSIEQTPDGGYIVVGYSHSNDGDVVSNHGENDFWILKLESDGDLEWQKTLGGSNNEKAYSVKQTLDGGYIVAGFSGSDDGDVTGGHGSFDYWVTKLYSSGNLEWQKCYGGSNMDMGASIALTNDGYIITGQASSNDGDVTGNHGDYDYWTVKTDLNGNLEWQTSQGGIGEDIAYAIYSTSDNGYIVAGFSKSDDGDVTGNHGGYDVWVVKIHSEGSFSWEESLGGTTTDGAAYIEQTSDGGYLITGSSNSVDGDVTGNHGGFDYWVIKLDADFATGELSITNNQSVYPNPFNDHLVIPKQFESLRITDFLGREVNNEVFNNIINTEELYPGIYFAEVTFKDGSKSITKVIKQ